MAGAFVDGALKGFNMMERHQERLDNKARLSDLDAFEKKKYNDEQGRLADIDKRYAKERAEEVAFKNKEFDSLQQYRANTLIDLDRNFEEKQKNSLWKQNYQEKQDTYKKDMSILPAAFDLLEQDSPLPEEYEAVFKRNPHLDPRRLFEKEAGESVDTVQRIMGEVAKTGEVARFNEPEFTGAINNIYSDRFKKAVGQYDPVQNSEIVDSEFYSFIPVPRDKTLSDVRPDGKVDGERFAMSMLVTYKNGNQEVKPVTRGGTTEPDDPVSTFNTKGFLGDLKPVFVAREIAKSPEMYRRHAKSIEGTLQTGSQQKEAPQEAEYRKHYLDLTKRREEALSDINAVDNLGMPLHPDKEARKKQIEAEFNNLKSELDGVFGKKSEATNKDSVKYVSKIDGIDAQSVVVKFMEANKGLTEQQATQIAIQQGYLSNDQ